MTGDLREAALKNRNQSNDTRKKKKSYKWEKDKYMPTAEKSHDLHFTQVFRRKNKCNRTTCKEWHCAWLAERI